MPSINADGTLNTSTDGAFDMDNEDEYYHFVCGLISASVNIKGRKAGEQGTRVPRPSDDDDKKEYIDPDVIDIKTVTQQPGLVCCFNVGEHFYNYILDSLDPEEREQQEREILARFNYQKRLGDPRWDITMTYPVFYTLVNTSSEPMTFNEVVITFGSAGISTWQTMVTHDCQPYAAEIKRGIMRVDSKFTISTEDEAMLESFFQIRPSDVLYASPSVKFTAAEPITIRPYEAVSLLSLLMWMGGKTVYINGETPVQMTPNFWGVEYSIFGAYGQDGNGGFYATPSYAYNTSTNMKYGIQAHCSCTHCTGARWYERWSEDYPDTYWTYYPNGTQVSRPQKPVVPDNPSTKVFITTYVKNPTDTPAKMTIRLYGQQYDYTIPAGFEGQTDIEIDVPPSISTTDNTSLDISSQFNISIDKGEVSNTVVSISNNPTIPTIPTISFLREQKVALTDYIGLTLTGTRRPDVEDKLLLIDNTYISHSKPAPSPDHIEELVLTDTTYVEHQVPFTGPTVNDILLLEDKINLNVVQPFTGAHTDKLILTDSISTNK